jgi:DNA-directed RNA polymerase specialized sigma24 family protein
MNTLRLILRFQAVRRPLSLTRVLTLLLTCCVGIRGALGLPAALAFGLPPAQAAVTEAWVHRYCNRRGQSRISYPHIRSETCDSAGLTPSTEEAEDITHDFFTRLLEKQALGGLRREGGKFRSFLLGAMANFLADEWDRAQAQKRGSGRKPLSLDAEDGEARFQALALAGELTPESAFEKQWAVVLLEHVAEQLRAEEMKSGKGGLFDDLRPHLQSDRAGLPYAEIATRHGTSEGAIKVAVHRLRHRFGQQLREQIARTVSSPAEVDEELRHLINVMKR